MPNTINTLNRMQQKAAGPEGGVTLVVAGAGTGKTRTMIAKICSILGSGLMAPENVLVLTFSRKAAGEIRQRVESAVGPGCSGITAGTFHSFCLGFLREHAGEFMAREGFSVFPSVFGDEQREEMLRELICRRMEDFMGLPSNVIYSFVNDGRRVPAKTRKKLERFNIARALESLGKDYAGFKKLRNVMDYEDMIHFSIGLLKDSENIRNRMRRRYGYILVDEFQDTSGNNFELLKLMLPENSPNLFAVGDDWQSIYGFRDSRIEYIVKMRKYFPSVNICRLDVNYRSHREITDMSCRFIKKNRFRTRKRLKSVKGRGGRVAGYGVKTPEEELERITQLLKQMACTSRATAVLYRNNWQGDVISSRVMRELTAEASGSIQFMTMHASKGLEFDTVILAGISDEILPDAFSDIEEERRLLYVAMTRAERELHLIFHLDKTGKIPVFARELGFNPRNGTKMFTGDFLTMGLY